MSKKPVGSGAAGGRPGSEIVIGHGTGQTIAVVGERCAVTGMVAVGREGTSMDLQGNLWACWMRKAVCDTGDHGGSGKGWRRLQLDTCAIVEPLSTDF